MNSKLLKITLSVLVVIFLIAGYLYLTGKMKFNSEPAEEITETSDWKTYRNKKYGLEMKYPKNWHNEESENEMVTFISSGVFEESSRLMVGIRRKGEDSYIGFSTGRGVDKFVQKGNAKINGLISKPYFLLGENGNVSSVEFRNIEGGQLVETGDFEIVASLEFMYNPEFKNIEENTDYQISKKILKSMTLGD